MDFHAAVAYELKVSKNNTHFEFYCDIFKVIVHHAHQPRWPIQKLIFITSIEGATKLVTRYGQAVRALAEQHHSLAVEICGIELVEGMTMPSSAACPREGSFLGRSERPALAVLAMEQFAGRR